MAETKEDRFEKYCLPYYNTEVCPKGPLCAYRHKKRFEVDAVAFLRGADFFLGELPVPRTRRAVCHFYKLGKCLYQNNCRFLHDNDNSLEGDKTEEKESVKGVPSTSNQAEGALTDNKSGQNDISGQNASEKTESAEGSSASPPSVLVNRNLLRVDAPEFVPRNKQKSYAEAVVPEGQPDQLANRKLCPYTTKEGVCVNLATCTNVHGEFCDMCERFVLHPYNEDERKKHLQECIKQHEKDMELSFAIQRSKEKACGVCFEVIMEKANGEQRFGILPNCNHCFCLTCIRKWRQARQFENKIIRACPECRVTSDFVCPSSYWVDTKEDKDKLIEDYKEALSRKDCKYFQRGEGKCPFGNKCFYMHATPDGNKIDVGPPQRRRQGHSDSEMDVLQVMLWDFLDERDFPWQSLADDLDDLVSFFTDSDESDWSDYELFVD